MYMYIYISPHIVPMVKTKRNTHGWPRIICVIRTNTRSYSWRRRISIPFYSRSGGGGGGGLPAIKVRNGLSTAIRVAQTH